MLSVAVTGREVALTLDDGPDPSTTPQVLDVLSRHGARATFFVLGSAVEAHPGLARAMADAGHELGNHGWTDTPAVLATRAQFRGDLDRTNAAVVAATGVAPALLRPGSGWVRPAQVRDAARLGLTTVLGSVVVLDDEVNDVEAAAGFVLDRVQPGSVVVLHEGLPGRARVADLLDVLVPGLRGRGQALVTVSELLAGAARVSPSAQRSIS